MIVGRMSGEGGANISGTSSITGIRGESTISWVESFRNCLKSLTSFEKVGLCAGLVIQQASRISCKPWVVNRGLLGSGGRVSSSTAHGLGNGLESDQDVTNLEQNGE